MAVEDTLISVLGTGQSLEGVAVTTPAGSDLVREGVVLSDPETAAARVKVTNAAPGSSDYGAVVRIAGPIDSSDRRGAGYRMGAFAYPFRTRVLIR